MAFFDKEDYFEKRNKIMSCENILKVNKEINLKSLEIVCSIFSFINHIRIVIYKTCYLKVYSLSSILMLLSFSSIQLRYFETSA